MPLFQDDGTTVLSKGTQDGDSMDESKHFQSDGQTLAKSPRVVMVKDDGTVHDISDPFPVELSTADRELLIDIRSLLQQLVRLSGGIA